MIINSSGISKADLTDYLGFWTAKLREVYGDSFVIRKEGLVDNIATAGSLTCMALEDIILYLSKQMNPYTAEGEFQDALYSLIGLVRNYATFTKTQRTIIGEPNTLCLAGDVRFKNKATDDIFVLDTDIIIGDTGKAKGTFKAIELGAIELDAIADLEIVDAPEGITKIIFEEDDTTIVGDDFEDDAQFRTRWLINQSVPGSATTGGLYAALLPLVSNNMDNLKIRQNRDKQDYLDMPTHTLEVIINTPESDETVAQTIYDNIVDGVGMFGDIVVQKQDSVGTPVEIRFTRAKHIKISFKVEVVVLDGYYLTQIESEAQNAIFNNFSYEMGEKVVANDYVQYVRPIEGVDYVASIKVQKNDEGWVDVVTTNYNEKPVLESKFDIQVTEG